MDMKKLNIELGDDYNDMQATVASGPTTHYPSFTYSDDEELGIPTKGKMLIEFEETRKEKSTYNGKTRYTCTISVKKILGAEASKSEDKKDIRADDALDAIKEALERKDSDDDEGGY